MDVHIRRVDLKYDIEELMRQDHIMFPVDAYDSPDDWEGSTPYWLILDGQKIGTTAFAEDVDVDPVGEVIKAPGNCYFETTGVLPEFRSNGFGILIKAYEISYAKHHDFERVSTTCRESNEIIIGLNEMFGLKRVYTIPEYYPKPIEAGVQLARTF